MLEMQARVRGEIPEACAHLCGVFLALLYQQVPQVGEVQLVLDQPKVDQQNG